MWCRFLLIVCGGLTLGCVSYLTVEKVPVKGSEDVVEGIRYSLPQPFLLVKPAQTGGIDVEVVYLPDPTNEYAIESRSFLATSKFDVQLEKGLLKQVVFNPDASAVARQLAESAGNFGKAEIEANTEAAKKRAEAKAVAQQKVAEAQGEVLKAKKKLDGLEKLKNDGVAGLDDEIKKAKIAIVDAEAAAAKADEAARAGGFNVPASGKTGVKPDLPQAWGPVLFRIVEGTNGVELRAVDTQRLFDTYKPQTKTNPKMPSLGIKGSATVKPESGKLQFVIVSDLPLDQVKSVKLVESSGAVTNRVLSQSLQLDSKKEIVVNLEAGTPQGSYSVAVAYEYKGKTTQIDLPIRVEP